MANPKGIGIKNPFLKKRLLIEAKIERAKDELRILQKNCPHTHKIVFDARDHDMPDYAICSDCGLTGLS